MKRLITALTFATAILTQATTSGQAHAGTPEGASGICKDGTYSTATAKDGACRGHKGVQTWYSQATATIKGLPAAAAISPPLPPVSTGGDVPPAGQTAGPLPASQAQATSITVGSSPPVRSGISAERAKLASMQPASGGGPGLVWLNGTSMVYHCPDSDFYGKTKSGGYMSEADAKAKGAHPNHNKPCD